MPVNPCFKYLTGFLISALGITLYAQNSPLLIRARNLFYASVEQADSIPDATRMFESLKADTLYTGRATVYLGALKALEGKHAFFPMTKYKRAIKGLEIMDQGVAINPDDIESLFIRGSTCYFMPFFFKRSDTAQQDFQSLIRLLPEKHTQYPDGLVNNVIEFLFQYADMAPETKQQLETVLQQLELE